MEVPSPAAGVVKELKIKVGDKVSQGTLILTLEAAGQQRSQLQKPRARKRRSPRRRSTGAASPPAPQQRRATPRRHAARLPRRASREKGRHPCRSRRARRRPGGYTAAFRAADLGKKTVLIERYADARRRVPERRLHPVESAAARRESHHRSRGDWPRRRLVRQAQDRRREAPRVEGRRGRQARRKVSRAWRSSAK